MRQIKKLFILFLIISIFVNTGCSSDNGLENVIASDGMFSPGIYYGKGKGNNGYITVEVEFSADEIISVNVIDDSESTYLSGYAAKNLAAMVIEKQSLAVDVVAGVTKSSKGILEAIGDCIEQAGGDLSLWVQDKQTVTEQAETRELSADVVVVGAGVSGLCAAVSAAHQGAKVILIEKMAVIGGSAASTLGTFMICQVPENADYHIYESSDTLDDALARWKSITALGREDSYPDYERLKPLLISTMSAVHWLKLMGSTFEQSFSIKEYGQDAVDIDIPTIKEGSGMEKLTVRLAEELQKEGGIILTQTEAVKLLQEEGQIAGIEARTTTRDLIIKGQAVILACGGFGASEELVYEYIPDLKNVGYVYLGVSGNTGEGLRMVEEVGGVLYEDNWIVSSYITPSIELLETDAGFYRLIERSGLVVDPETRDSSYDHLIVTSDGRRFMNEASHYSIQNTAMMDEDGAPYYVLYDGVSSEIVDVLEKGIPSGEVIKGDTLEELAENAGMNETIFLNTVNRYNQMIASGEDTDYGKDPERLHWIDEEGPYYLVHFVCSFGATLGGVHTDENFRVLYTDGTVIDGLYAIGQMANRPYYGKMYISGSSLTFGVEMGMITGEDASKRAKDMEKQ